MTSIKDNPKMAIQGFPYGDKGWEGGRIGNFAGGEFFTGWLEPEVEWFRQFQPFPKLKTAFSEYWTTIKIKISMTCVYKEYEIKTKMVQEHWLQLKMKFLLGYNMEIVI